jgi:hypothetical protein
MCRTALIIVLPLMLAGCITDREEGAFLSSYYTRADIDAITATMACKNAARSLVQIARCEVRR